MMNKFVNYFFAFFAFATLTFLASCSEEDLPPVTDEATLSFEVNGAEADTAYAFAGETVVIDVQIDYGDEEPTDLVVKSAAGTELNTYPLTNTPASIQYTYDIESNVSADVILTFELRDGSSSLVSEEFTIDIQPATVADAISENEDLSDLDAALTTAGLVSILQGDGPFTIFAPSNEALADFDASQYTEEELSSILLSHVVMDSLTANELSSEFVKTGAGDSVYVDVTAGAVTVNGVSVSQSDIIAGNGVVHIIDEVLIPDVTTYATFLLASPTGEGGSETFFSTSSGERYSYNGVLATAEPVSETIDFGYFYGQTDEATIASPDSWPDNAALYSGLAAWNTRNDTDFRATTMLPEDFAVVSFSQGSDVEAEFEAGTELDNPGRAKGLQADDVIAFKTADGRFGLFKVVEIVDGNNDGNFDGIQDGIEIEVKVTK